MEEIAQESKTAYKIIERKKQHIMELQWLSEEFMKQSSEMKNLYYQYLLSNMIPMELKVLHLSMPAIVGKNGIEKQLAIAWNEKEQKH